LRFGGNVLPYKSAEELAALREAKATTPEYAPDMQLGGRTGSILLRVPLRKPL
jgi:hypothetical protein